MSKIIDEKLYRIRAIVSLEPVDRVPFMCCAPAFSAAVMGKALADHFSSMENCCTNLLEATRIYAPEIDGLEGALYDPYVLPFFWATKVSVPGDSLPDNELWQMEEKELIRQSDYDKILEKGIASFKRTRRSIQVVH